MGAIKMQNQINLEFHEYIQPQLCHPCLPSNNHNKVTQNSLPRPYQSAPFFILQDTT